jgi:uncharacterized repeat protein (TIGR03806 family)
MKKYIIILLLPIFTACIESQQSDIDEITKLIETLKDNPSACNKQTNEVNAEALATQKCNWLSNYHLFITQENNSFIPNSPTLKYEINSALFTDFSQKQRFVYVPNSTQAQFHTTNNFEFPVNSVLIKVFSLPQSKQIQPIEVRLLIKRNNGWIFLPYIWSKKHQDAFYYPDGYELNTSVYENQKKHEFTYSIPGSLTCGECHQNKDNNGNITFLPIGPKARHLNKVIEYNGEFTNQLTLWHKLGKLNNMPNDLSVIDTAPNWQDESVNVQDRAKAYLDINCAHCHNENGSAALSGLRLEYWRKSITHAHGVCNSSHGWRGGGFDIWPGRGEISSIPIRMRHTDAKDRMPPIGRSLVDEQAAQLISDWIDSMPLNNCVD